MAIITLDHIVILVSPQVLDDLPTWLTSAFTITDGGTHSNGITKNKLIFFQDGVYIELIAFVEGTSPPDRASTRWGQRTEGQVVDFALTLLPPEQLVGDFNPENVFRTEIQTRVREAQNEFEYADPAAGGRTTPDGTELRWAVAVPRRVTGESVEGELPFWCLDRTPRDLRVPFKRNRGATEHKCEAVGVCTLELFVKGEEDILKVRAVYETFLRKRPWIYGSALGWKGFSHQKDELFSKGSWDVEVPERVIGNEVATRLILRGWGQDPLGKNGASSKQVEAESSSGDERPVRISIALFTNGPSRVVSGEVASGRVLEIKLISV
ncbi:glyoxalase-like domain-containing protein [Apodospora peruviana]|uniref:Glyoxalase-like domain-containing protein n=1 Tax=Apodospora peruviana TaxID=516989 RepID=A0AAE0IDN1_9PEZI|nr:glyoxalase-like domain-containing protein [Apodospora peruviana]